MPLLPPRLAPATRARLLAAARAQLGDAPGLGASFVHAVYRLSAAAVDRPEPLRSARRSEWRCLVDEDGEWRTVVALRVGGGGWRSDGALALTLANAADRAAERLEGLPGAFAPRVLECAAANVTALWLVARDGADLFLPLPDGELLSAEAFVAHVRASIPVPVEP